MSTFWLLTYISGGVMGYLAMAGATARLLWHHHPKWDEDDCAVAGVFWPLIAPYGLVRHVTFSKPKRELPEARIHR